MTHHRKEASQSATASQDAMTAARAAATLGVAGRGKTGRNRLTDETHARTIVKSLSWRVGGFIMTVGVAWIVTGRVELAASIGLADTLVKVLAFYAHERLWLRIPFGRRRAPEYEI